MNTPKELQRIYNKLPKTELKSEKIKLGLIDDIRSEMKKANEGAINAIDLAFKARPLADKALPLNENLLKKIAQTKKAAIELGATEVLKDLQVQENQVKSNISEIQKLIKGLNSI
tara:strand:- start:303 stop:647 length:345 start_codon:yes stop_codon:yes gene_type:complete